MFLPTKHAHLIGIENKAQVTKKKEIKKLYINRKPVFIIRLRKSKKKICFKMYFVFSTSCLMQWLPPLFLLFQLHAIPPLSGTWRLGGVSSDFVLLLFLSRPPPLVSVQYSPNQWQQRGPKPLLLSYWIWCPGGKIQRSALLWWGKRVWREFWPGLHLPCYRQQWPNSPSYPAKRGTGGLPGCHHGAPSTQAAQHTAGQEETVGVSTVHSLTWWWFHKQFVACILYSEDVCFLFD